MILEDKNNAQGFTEELKVEDGFYLLKFQNETSDNQKIIRDIVITNFRLMKKVHYYYIIRSRIFRLT